jgi:Domain of unknown function (DUF5658)
MSKLDALILFAIIQVADIVTTSVGLHAAGLYEGNPVVALWMDMLGPLWWLPKLGIVLFAVLVSRRLRRVWPLTAISALTFFAVINNLARL